MLVLGGHPLRLRTWAGQAPSPCSTCAAAADLLPLESRSSCAAPRAGALGTWGRPSRAALSRRGLPPAAEVPLQEALPTTLSQAPVRGAGRGAPAAPPPSWPRPRPALRTSRRRVHSALTPGPGPGGADNSCLRPAAPQTKAGPPGGPAPRPPPPAPETEPPPGTKFLPTCLSSAGIGPGAGSAGRRRRWLDRDRLRCLGRSAGAWRTRSPRADLAERRLAADGRGGATRRAANRAEPSWGGAANSQWGGAKLGWGGAKLGRGGEQPIGRGGARRGRGGAGPGSPTAPVAGQGSRSPRPCRGAGIFPLIPSRASVCSQ